MEDEFEKSVTIQADPSNIPRSKEADLIMKYPKSVKLEEPSGNKPILLIVEDNRDLRKYIKHTLSDQYYILEAEDGSKGLLKAFEHIPDLVISDLMMPGLDGVNLCEQLKTDHRTNHIPLIMLTAVADRDSKMESLEKGADDYILKPFDSEELMVRVKNLIDQRENLRNHYLSTYLNDSINPESPTQKEPFIEKLILCIQNHLTDPEFGVEELGQKIGLSRTQLYRKTMAIVNISPSELIRNSRLKMAAKLFREGNESVSEVLYSVGFSNPSNFATHFRNMFGKNPKEYMKQFLKGGTNNRSPGKKFHKPSRMHHFRLKLQPA